MRHFHRPFRRLVLYWTSGSELLQRRQENCPRSYEQPLVLPQLTHT
jgi:hypothetical protein